MNIRGNRSRVAAVPSSEGKYSVRNVRLNQLVLDLQSHQGLEGPQRQEATAENEAQKGQESPEPRVSDFRTQHSFLLPLPQFLRKDEGMQVRPQGNLKASRPSTAPALSEPMKFMEELQLYQRCYCSKKRPPPKVAGASWAHLEHLCLAWLVLREKTGACRPESEWKTH